MGVGVEWIPGGDGAPAFGVVPMARGWAVSRSCVAVAGLELHKVVPVCRFLWFPLCVRLRLVGACACRFLLFPWLVLLSEGGPCSALAREGMGCSVATL